MHHMFVLLQPLTVCGGIETNPGPVCSLTSNELFIFNLNIRNFRIKYIYWKMWLRRTMSYVYLKQTWTVMSTQFYIWPKLFRWWYIVFIYLSANRSTIWKWWGTKTFGWKYVCQIWKYTFVQYIDTRNVRILIGQTFYWKETQPFSTYLCLNKPNCGFKCWHIIIAKSYIQRYYIV